MRKTSKLVAAVGMTVLVYSTLWAGPRPATVVGEGRVVGPADGGDSEQYADVNPIFNGFTDDESMARFDPISDHGTVRVRVFDPLTPEQISQHLANADNTKRYGNRFIAVWPPPATGVAMVRERDGAAGGVSEPAAAAEPAVAAAG